MMKTVLRAALAAVLLGSASLALAVPVTYDITGVITSADNSAAIGDTLVGSITLDLANAESSYYAASGVPNSADYVVGTQGGPTIYGTPIVNPVFSLILAGGGYSYQTSVPGSGDFYADSSVEVDSGGTVFKTAENDTVTNNFTTYSGSHFTTFGISEDSSGLFTFNPNEYFVGGFTQRINGGTRQSVSFQISSFAQGTPVPIGAPAGSSIPTPASASLLLAGLAGLLARRRGHFSRNSTAITAG